jgi:sterol desaturase/sphingolipid hydroxylase (fatty acid hydroxylase superfamily)
LSRQGSVRPRKGILHVNHQQLQQQQQRLRAKLVLKAVEDASMRDAVYRKVFSLCLALFITIWCSIFQASFFAFCDSPQGRDIEQILYFVRLFSDLLGRPLTRLPRPWFLQENHHVLSASVARISLMLIFFFYVFIASFPKWVPCMSCAMPIYFLD